MSPLRCLYVDLDGTLLGRGASLLHDADGAFSLLGVRALEACARADVEVVIFSGRRRAQVAENARMLGHTAFIYEVGCAVCIDGEDFFLTSGLVPRADATVNAQIAATGAPELLLEAFAGKLEYHDPWHHGREFSHLFRGDVDVAAADRLLAEHDLDFLRLVDNGGIHRQSRTLDIDGPGRAFHLIPREASKAGAVEHHRRVRGYAAEECIAAGDSSEDLGAAAVVGTFWMMANGLERDPSVGRALAAAPNARVTETRNGAGVYEAVVTTLAERR